MFAPEPLSRPIGDPSELSWLTSWRKLAWKPFRAPCSFADDEEGRIGLPEIAAFVGLPGEELHQALSHHEQALSARWRTAHSLYSVAVLVCTGMLLLAWQSLPEKERLAAMTRDRPLVLLAAIATFLLLALAYSAVALRIAILLTDRYYADTLSAITILYILAELRRGEPFTSPLVKRMLLIRMNYLVRSLLFLSYRFPAGDATRSWASTHFAQILSYIRERERWIVAPRQGTAEVLQRELLALAPVLVQGHYGEFVWSDTPGAPDKPRNTLGLLLGLSGRGIGFLLPVIVLLYLLYDQPHLQALKIPTTVIALVLLAWFLVTVNVVFRLGVVEGVVNLARAIKDLA